jgi:hypothetical protein
MQKQLRFARKESSMRGVRLDRACDSTVASPSRPESHGGTKQSGALENHYLQKKVRVAGAPPMATPARLRSGNPTAIVGATPAVATAGSLRA